MVVASEIYYRFNNKLPVNGEHLMVLLSKPADAQNVSYLGLCGGDISSKSLA